MKQKDITTIAFIVGVSALVSIFVSRMVISSPKNSTQKVEVVEKISADFTRPDAGIFNKDAVNPTQNIQIGSDNTTKPSFSQ